MLVFKSLLHLNLSAKRKGPSLTFMPSCTAASHSFNLRNSKIRQSVRELAISKFRQSVRCAKCEISNPPFTPTPFTFPRLIHAEARAFRIYLSIYLSLSLSLYIYIYMYVSLLYYIYIVILSFGQMTASMVSKVVCFLKQAAPDATPAISLVLLVLLL